MSKLISAMTPAWNTNGLCYEFQSQPPTTRHQAEALFPFSVYSVVVAVFAWIGLRHRRARGYS